MHSLAAILVLLLSLAACVGYGGLWLRLFSPPERLQPLRPLLAVVLGMGTLAYLILAAGLLGQLHAPVLGLLLATGWGLSVPFWRSYRVPSEKAADLDSAWEPRLAVLAIAGLVVLAVMSLVSALAPVGGLDWDSLSYHLAAPKIYLRAGHIGLIAYDSHTDFPATMEMLYLLGLQWAGGPGGKLFHWAAGWLTAAALWGWTSTLEVNGRRLPRWAGPAAALAFASMPLVLWEMSTAYVDLGTALFQLLALACLVEAVADRERGVHPGGAALAGLFSGFALGTKYTALLQFGLLGLVLIWALFRSPGKERSAGIRAVLLFGVLGGLVAAPWYVKNWLWVHNPVYPFYYSLFPHSFSWNKGFEQAYYGEQKLFGYGATPEAYKSPASLVTALWNLGLHGRAFFITFRSFIGDRIGSLGPLWIGLLPLLPWTRGLGLRFRLILLYSGLSILVWFFMTQQSRYLMPVFAPLAVVAAGVLATLEVRPLRLAAGAFTGFAVLLCALLNLPLAQMALPVVTGAVSEAEYLHANGDIASLAESARFVNTLPADSRVALYQETRGFYFDRDYFWANPGQHDMIPYDRLRTGDELADTLRGFRITHVLINYDNDPTRGYLETPWYRLLQDAIRRGRLKPLYSTDGALLEGRGIFIYQLQ